MTSLSFVKDELFPYARGTLPEYLRTSGDRPDVAAILDHLGRELGTTDVDRIAETLVRWIDEDRKHPDLKELQGIVWEEGYRAGAYRGHLYPDVLPFWEQARQRGRLLAIYSSGSVSAQKLLLRYSSYGDVSGYIDHYFDLAVGGKTDPSSYERLAAQLTIPSPEILFFSDALPELDAARSAGFQTCRLLRPGVPKAQHDHQEIADFTVTPAVLPDDSR